MPLGERRRDAERVEQLQLDASGRIERVRDVALERLEPARRPDRRVALLGAERQPRADREDLGAEPEQRVRAVARRTSSPRRPARRSSRMSILLMTTTTFLPQPRICSRNARSVSVNGRSAEVTNSTRSERGTNSAVIRSCSRMIALVPGVSTMWMSRRSGTGAVMTWRAGSRTCRSGRLAVLQDVDLRRRRGHAFFDDPAADERVDEGALAGVELADDHEQEELVELLDRPLERGLLIGRGVELRESECGGVPRTRRSSFRSSSCRVRGAWTASGRSSIWNVAAATCQKPSQERGFGGYRRRTRGRRGATKRSSRAKRRRGSSQPPFDRAFASTYPPASASAC